MSTGNTPTMQSTRDRATIEDVKQDVKALKQDVTDVAKTGVDAAQAGAETTLEAGKQAAEAVRSTHESLCRYVSQHPTASVLIAVGVGAMIARMIPRS